MEGQDKLCFSRPLPHVQFLHLDPDLEVASPRPGGRAQSSPHPSSLIPVAAQPAVTTLVDQVSRLARHR